MPLKLYKMDISPPCCAVMMVCEILNVRVEMIEFNLLEKKHLSIEYLQINPLHTIPLLEDGDLYIHESHVILTYIMDKYGQDDSLYPKDLKKRALVDQKLYFSSLLFTRAKNISFAAVIEGIRKPSEKALNDLREACDTLEIFLTKTKFIAGDFMTIADISLVASVSEARFFIPINDTKYPKTATWFSFMEKQPFYQKCTAPGLPKLKEIIFKYLEMEPAI